jgi:hypothetical protein
MPAKKEASLSKVIAQFELRWGRKPNDEELAALKNGMNMSIEQIKMSGCMINYPYPGPVDFASRQFELRWGRKPNAKELQALEKGTRLSVEQLKIGGCLINYPIE